VRSKRPSKKLKKYFAYSMMQISIAVFTKACGFLQEENNIIFFDD